MKLGNINTICVCGAGTMGRGIAQLVVQHGFGCVLYDVNGAMIQQSPLLIGQALQQLVDRGKIRESEKSTFTSRLTTTNRIEDCQADLVIEAIVEDLDLKTKLLRQLHTLNDPRTIFTSNTSSLAISQIARSIPEPERFAGLHFFNPAPVMKLVEIVKGESTSNETMQNLIEVSRRLHKTPVICKDAPGFIVNHVARPFYLEALRLLEEGFATVETIDSLLEATGFKMGPFRLMDLIGNDINYAVSCSVYTQLNKPLRLRPSAIQEARIKAGELGRKTGKGYYQY